MSAPPQKQVQLAGLGRRIVATLIDTVALFFCLVVLVGVATAAGLLQLPAPTSGNPFDMEAARATLPSWTYFATYALLFLYYSILEAFTGGSLGKLALGMRVVMDDGRAASTNAIVIRNLIRIPEAFLWYIPSAISCGLSARRKRLGDFAAGTIVVRTGVAAPVYAQPRPQHPTPPAAVPPSPTPPSSAAPVVPGLPQALARLKVAVLATRGAHDAFLRFSAQELARQDAQQEPAGAEPQYGAEYVAGWYSLSDAVNELNQARGAAAEAASRAGVTLDDALATQPDILWGLRQLAPYLAPNADDHLHEAYMQVVHAETQD